MRCSKTLPKTPLRQFGDESNYVSIWMKIMFSWSFRTMMSTHISQYETLLLQVVSEDIILAPEVDFGRKHAYFSFL